MTTSNLPADLAAYQLWAVRLALTPIITASVQAILAQEGRLIEIPGQKGLYVSEAHALEALERFCSMAPGARNALVEARKQAEARKQYEAKTFPRSRS